MSEEELNGTIKTAAATEAALAIAIDNIVNTFNWSGLERDRQAEVEETLRKLAEACEERAERFKKLAKPPV
jgi:hypothetical protein